MSIDYEFRNGYVNSGCQNVPESSDWQQISWRVDDANFVGAWGWMSA